MLLPEWDRITVQLIHSAKEPKCLHLTVILNMGNPVPSGLVRNVWYAWNDKKWELSNSTRWFWMDELLDNACVTTRYPPWSEFRFPWDTIDLKAYNLNLANLKSRTHLRSKPTKEYAYLVNLRKKLVLKKAHQTRFPF